MTYLISNLFLVACYIVSAGRAPVVLTKSPALAARIAAYPTVRAFAFGAEVPATRAGLLAAYKSRKVRILDFGTSIVVHARCGPGKGMAFDTRFVVCA